MTTTSKEEQNVSEQQEKSKAELEFDVLSDNVRKDLVQFRKQLHLLNKKELIRLVTKIIESPLEETVNMKTDLGVNLANLGLNVKQSMVHMTLKFLEIEGSKDTTKEKENE